MKKFYVRLPGLVFPAMFLVAIIWEITIVLSGKYNNLEGACCALMLAIVIGAWALSFSLSNITFTNDTIIYKKTLFSRKKSFLISDVEKIWLGFRTHGSAGGHGGYIDVVKFFVKDSNKVYTVWLTPALLKYLIALFPKEKIKVKMVYLTKKYKKILLESGVLSDKKMKEIKHL